MICIHTNNCTTFCATFFWSRSEPGRAETRLGFQPAPGHGACESHGRRLAVDAVGLGHGRCGALGLGGPLGCLQRALGILGPSGDVCRCVLFWEICYDFRGVLGLRIFWLMLLVVFFLKRTAGISCELRGSVKLFFQPCDFGAGYLEKSRHVVRGWISNFCEVAHQNPKSCKGWLLVKPFNIPRISSLLTFLATEKKRTRILTCTQVSTFPMLLIITIT